MREPVVSVVTVNFRNSAGLQRTIESVVSQDYPSIEFIVKDGGSGGADAEVLDNFGSLISIMDDSPDHGIYDAMNVGAQLSSGEWVIFMNSGDVFHNKSSISDAMKMANPTADIICGHARLIDPNTKATKFIKAELPEILPYRMNASHQAIFSRRSLTERFPFLVGANNISSDYRFLLECYMSGFEFGLVNVVVADCEAGGVSQVSRITSIKDRVNALKAAGAYSLSLKIYYSYLVIRAVFVKKLRVVFSS